MATTGRKPWLRDKKHFRRNDRSGPKLYRYLVCPLCNEELRRDHECREVRDAVHVKQ